MSSGILEVQLVDAQGLGSTDLFNKMDPYVVVQYRSQEQKSKVAREEGKNPVWNETLKFKVQHSGSGQNQHKLHLRIMDHDTFTRDDFVGEATIHVSEVIESGLENGFFEHKPTKYSVVLADRSYYGSIRVGLTFTKRD